MVGPSPNSASICPPMSCGMLSLVLRNGTWINSIPASRLSSSMARWVTAPIPAEPMVSLLGLALA
jgi:hypothetical protein